MQISVISFTKKGLELSGKIQNILPNYHIELYTKYKNEETEEESKSMYVVSEITRWANEQMDKKQVLVFIGACGIAVRAIAPYVKDKLQDSPVLVLDEQGRFVIPILSGHVGGANELAREIADGLRATAVITTATDINQKFAVDLFAKKNSLSIKNKAGIAKISSKILDGKKITVAIEEGHWKKTDRLPKQVEVVENEKEADILITSREEESKAMLFLQPKEYIIGIGCKRGKEEEKLQAWIEKNLTMLKISKEQIYAMATIDVKKEEEGLLAISQKERITLLTYSAEELEGIPGDFQESEFVKGAVGVSNVCERAALLACGEGGSLVYRKHAEDGMTIAIAKRKWSVSFDEC